MSSPGYETRDLSPRHAVIFVGALLLTGIVTAGIVWGIADFMRSSAIEAHGPARHPLAQARVEPPTPRLQVVPSKDIASYRSEIAQTLTTYGWVQREAGVVRLPVERALELVLKEGLDTRSLPQTNQGAAP